MTSSCRVCLQPNGSLPLSAVSTANQTAYVHLFNDCTRLDAALDDPLPQCLCLQCAEELQRYGELLSRARESDLHLRDLLPTGRLLKVEQQVGCFGKDPLEETDDDEENLTLDWPGGEENDDDDDKPLKYLLNKPATAENIPTAIEASSSNEAPQEEEYITNEIMPHSTVTVDEQIFPSGRFRCLVCGKAYFTTVGLNAHLEVHRPKQAAAKKKRIRGPNKKKRSVKAAAGLADESETKTASNAMQKTENVDEDTAAETEHETAGGNSRRPRKQKPPKPKKIFPCHVCDKQMISASKLRYHMVMHTGEKNYLCAMCPKAYSTIYALKHHTRVHTGERPYECKFCGDRFLRPTTLKSHLRRHTGERPYGCNICGKRFIQHSSMTTHIKLNHMVRTIPCPHCDKKYARQTDLNTHLLSHTGDKPFSCKLCPSRFIRQANLNKHMNQHHADAGGDVKSAKPSTSRQRDAAKRKPAWWLDDAAAAAAQPAPEAVMPAFISDPTATAQPPSETNLCGASPQHWNWAAHAGSA